MVQKRILVIDDSKAVTKFLQMHLERSGLYEVRCEYGGEAGLAAAKQDQPDMILLDVNMPDMDGGQVAEQIKADPEISGTPIVFLTSVVSAGEAAKEETTIAGMLR